MSLPGGPAGLAAQRPPAPVLTTSCSSSPVRLLVTLGQQKRASRGWLGIPRLARGATKRRRVISSAVAASLDQRDATAAPLVSHVLSPSMKLAEAGLTRSYGPASCSTQAYPCTRTMPGRPILTLGIHLRTSNAAAKTRVCSMIFDLGYHQLTLGM